MLNRSLTAICMTFSLSPAWADIAAPEIWAEWIALQAAQGITMAAEEEIYADGRLTLTRITQTVDDPTAPMVGTLEQAIARLHAIEHFRDYAWYTNGNFITAFLRCLREVEKFDPKRLLKQAKKYPGQFVFAGSTDEFLRVFENTYNHNKVGRNRVRLF